MDLCYTDYSMKVIVDGIARAAQNIYGIQVVPELSRPDPKFGDFSCNIALQLSKKLGKNPREIGQAIADAVSKLPEVYAVEIAGPGFINITLADDVLLNLTQEAAVLHREGQTIVIETNNPNPFKAMHIGHALNAITADAIANLLEASGGKMYRVSYHGDVGLHVGKSMWSLLRYVEGDPSKLDHIPAGERNTFMSKMYAEGSRAYKDDAVAKAEIADLARQSFTREDPVYAAVYETIFLWSFEQIDAIVARLGNKPVVKRFLESDADARGVTIVRNNVPQIFQESQGALIFRGSEHGSFDNAFVGSNGLGLYAARDLGLMQLKNEQYHPDKSYIVTAVEQKDYFKGVIAAAELCFPELKGVTVNISSGTLLLTTGKMSSRDGDVIEIGWLFDQIKQAIRARGGEVTEAIVTGAIRYEFLKVHVGGDIVFDINAAVSIQGNSGPYLQYAHARACSILRKSGRSENTDVSKAAFDDNERTLLRKLSEYQEVVKRATHELLPHHICTYLYELAQAFNRFYETSRIISDEREQIRLLLVRQYRDTLAGGLKVLGIEPIESM